MTDRPEPLAESLGGRFVVPLDGRTPERELLGGKAAALDRLIAAGLAVPRSAVLTTAAYRAAVSTSPLREHLVALRATPVPPPDEHDAARAEIDRAFLAAPLPESVAGAIDELVGLVAAGSGSTLALRSSATAEDLTTASFAGQYRSFLHVRPDRDDVERAVRLTWASLWHPAPRTYRAFRGLGDDVEMAVLTMTMIEPTVAGVLFTRDPAGDADDIRLEWVAGVGESLVSGAATPESFVGARAQASAQVGLLHPRLVGRGPALIGEGFVLEQQLGCPQDIEWAIDDQDRLWFLQARPVTTLAGRDERDPADDGFDVRPDGTHALTTAGIGEMLPGVVPPLLWDVTSRQVEDGFRLLFHQLGAPLDDLADPHALVARVRGRAALDLDRLRAAAASIPGGSADELERRYFGEVLSTTASAAPTGRAGVRQGLRVLRDRHRAVTEAEVVTRAVAAVLDAEPDLGSQDDAGLLAYRARLLDLAARVAAAEITIAALAAAAFRGVETFLAKRLPSDEAATLAQRVTLRHGAARRGVAALDLDALGDVSTVCVELGVLDLDWVAARRVLETDHEGRRFLDRWSAMLRRAGSTAVFGGPTWADAPELAWLSLRSCVGRDAHTAGAARRDEALGSATAFDDVLARLHDSPGHGRLGFARRRFLQREIGDATELLDRREQTKSALLMLGGAARRCDDEVGERLTRRHRLEERDDVRLLGDRELSTLVTGRGPTMEDIARRRRHLDAATAAPPLPRLFRGEPTTGIGDAATAAASAGTATRQGWGASPGRYEGPARVLASPSSRAIRRGEVLIARTTDASWAPLFLVAGAIVVEQGGPLSHAAIIARELAAPAVVNVPGIVDAVLAAGPGAHVTVDGTHGIVRIHPADPGDELPVGRIPADGLPIVPARPAPVPPDPNRLGVFVTGLIGAGAALSAIVSITEAVGGGRSARRTRRRAETAATNAAAVVVHGTAHVVTTPVGLHARQWYGWVTAALAFAAAVVSWATLDQAADARDDLGVLWAAAGLMSGLPLAVLAALTASAARRWPAVPASVRRHLPARASADRPALWRLMPPLHRRLITALAAIVTVLLALAVTAESVLLAIDEPLYDALDANKNADLWSPDWFGMYFGRPQVVVPAALVVALFTVRCRVLALAYPLAIVFGGLLNMGLGVLVGRQRPPFSDHAAQTDSFPSGHAIEVTLLFGLAPLAIAVLLRSRWPGRIARVVASGVLAVMLADGVRDGSHWPSDHVAGFAIALVAVVFVHALARMPTIHDGCRACPTFDLNARQVPSPTTRRGDRR